ncbi:MAG: efflux RND transporter permease subunit [Deltaproteobacteria bacterium]|nr:efflux RND transporter permease subunit [Deltaproteobacteria bacterium]
MRGAIRWMAHNHVAANLLMIILMVGGLIRFHSIKREIFPEISLDMIQVSVAYPGAGPEEVEEGIILQIEENLTGVEGIRQIKSVAREGEGVVTAELYPGENPDLKLQEIKSEVDRIITFPEDAEKPVITKLLNRREVLSVALYGRVPERSLREEAETIRQELLEDPEITQVDLAGVRPYEISIEIPEENLRRYHLTLDQVARRVRQASLDLPGGTIKTSDAEILLRTKERRYRGPGYADIAVINRPDGTQIRLGQIAHVRDTFAETDLSARFDGQPAVMIKVFRVGDQKPLVISDHVRRYVEQKKKELPGALHIATWNDRSERLRSRMSLLRTNAVFGLILVMIILGLFLEIRLAFWVMLGVPVSFLGAMIFLPVFGVSINMISLFAFILALGILVDDATVVGESIYEHRQQGKTFLQASVDGTMEVGIPVVFSVLTTVVAFIPLLYVSGMIGKFIRVMPVVVITLLLVSLVESLFVLPAHLTMGKPGASSRGILGAIESVRKRCSSALEIFINGTYRRFLIRCLENRYTTVATGIVLLFLTVGVIKGGILKFHFMPVVDGDVVTASLKMPPGTPVAETARVQKIIERKARETVAEYDKHRPDGDSILRDVYAVVGGSMAAGGPGGGRTQTRTNLSETALFLQPSKKRGVPAQEIANRWREKVGEIPGVDSLVFTSNIVHMGANIDIQIAHENFAVLDAVSERIRKALSSYPGVGDIEDTYSRGKKELKIRLKPAAATLGITEEDLGRQVRSAFYGAEALRFQRGRNEVKVMVRYPETDRKHLRDLESMRIRTQDGGEVPLGRAAEVREGWGFSEIHRTNRKRVIDVTASVDDKVANAGDVLSDLKANLLPRLKADYPGLTFNMEGEEKERRESMGSMADGFLLALIGMFALLAIPFRSYSQPLLVMAAIPFGIVGAVAGHMIMGFKLSILSFFGIVALSGVVVNDSLILIDRVNHNRREGTPLFQAIIDGGTRRFRPILLTSLTTFFGLTPMILERSVQAQFLIPMAISLGFGILFATGITLLLIPSLYLVLEDVRGLLGLTSVHHRPDETTSLES